jgi:hypothetical protein
LRQGRFEALYVEEGDLMEVPAYQAAVLHRYPNRSGPISLPPPQLNPGPVLTIFPFAPVVVVDWLYFSGRNY